MEKSLATTSNGRINNHIHDDIAFTILAKLPLKSLTRFCCIRKTWCLLFQDSYFMSMFQNSFLSKNRSYYNDTTLILNYDVSWIVDKSSESGMYSLFGERFENMVNIGRSNIFHEDRRFYNILGSTSINGFICLYCKHTRRVVLWNPTIEKYKVIPQSHFESSLIHTSLHGFGYDDVGDDYKVIQNVVFSPRINESEDATSKDRKPNSLWEIYCLKSNSWKQIYVDMPTCYEDTVGVHVYMDGVCYWWGENKTQGFDCETHNDAYLVSFDLRNGIYVTTLISSNTDYGDYKYLTVLNRSIAMIFSYTQTTTFHISILGEVGVKESLLLSCYLALVVRLE